MLPYEECPKIFSCVFLDAWDLIDWRAIVITICFWIGAMLVAYARGKRRQVRRLWLGALNGSAATLAAIGLLLLGVVLFYSPWQRYKVLKEYTIEALKKKDETIGNQKKTVEALEAKLREQPKIIYREKRTSSSTDIEIARLRAELDQREKRKVIRNQITKMTDAGISLRHLCLVKEEKPECEKLANDWANSTHKTLASIEPSYASRFRASTGLSFSYSGVPKINETVVNFLTPKLESLTTILGELRD